MVSPCRGPKLTTTFEPMTHNEYGLFFHRQQLTYEFESDQAKTVVCVMHIRFHRDSPKVDL